MECDKDAIYQTILDKRFYDGTINLQKKYHFESHKEDRHFGIFGRYNTNKEDETKNHNASFNLNTKEFVQKISPTSDEYKLLVERMIHVLDMFYETSQNYDGYSTNFDIAIRNCMTFFLENTQNFKAP